MKIVINKLVGDLGEQWAIEFPVPSDILKAKGPDGPAEAIKAAVAPILKVVDDRLFEINMRLIAHNRAAQSLDPAGLLAVRQCVEVMYGGKRIGVDGPEGKGVQDVKHESLVEPVVEKAADALEKALQGVDQGR